MTSTYTHTHQSPHGDTQQCIEITIINRLGLHARAAAKVAALAAEFEAEQFLVREQQRADCKSIMSLLMLAAGQGTQLTLHATGSDASAALEAMQSLINNRFDEAD